MSTDPHTARPGQIITFYSYKGGTGRTMALANVAWILASHGYRVLAVDWDLESPGLHRFFHPLLADPQLRTSDGVIDLIRDYTAAVVEGGDGQLPPADVRRYAVSLDWGFAGTGELDLLPAGRQSAAYSATVSTFDWSSFYDRHGGAEFLKALRHNMRDHYDYVLIDSRTGLSDSAGICTVLLPDIVVNCFTLSTQSVDGAVAVAKSIVKMRADDPVRMVPVPMRVEDGEFNKLEAGRDYAWLSFAQFIEEQSPDAIAQYWGNVEIPYTLFYAYEEILTVFGDRARQPRTLLAAYERLTRAIVGIDLDPLAPMDETVRRLWLARFERTRPRAMTRALVSYTAEDRVWAEWIAGVLGGVGLPTILRETGVEPEERRTDADLIAVVVSSSYQLPEEAADWLRRAGATGRGRYSILSISIDGTVEPDIERFGSLDLSGMSGERARIALLTALNWPQTEAEDINQDPAQPRFPGNPPPVAQLPLRNANFTGRRRLLAEIRDHFSTHHGASVPLTLSGLGGVGKTEIAKEYAHRFAADYDVVWWVSAAQNSMVRAGLVDLADELRVPQADTTGERIRLLLEALRHGRPYRRWLIIFDSARDPDDLANVLPSGQGHVLVTSRSPLWGRTGHLLEVAPFGRDESVELLRTRLPAMAIEDAERVAERLGDLPLAVEQAGSWLAVTGMPVGRYLDLLDHQLSRILAENPPAGYERAGAITWLLSLDRLRERSPGAARLVEILAFFGPEPVEGALLYSRDLMAAAADGDPAQQDDVAFARLITEVRSYGLASFDEEHESLQMHRLVIQVIRESLPTETAERYRRQVHAILVAANPGESERPETWPAFARLWPHLVPSGALRSVEQPVRQLVLDVIRYLYRRSDFVGSAELSEAAINSWSQVVESDDDNVAIAKVHLANALRAEGDFERSLALDEEAIAVLGAEDRVPDQHTAQAMSGLGADVWSYGRYPESRAWLERALELYVRLFGPDHRRSIRAVNNLAVYWERVGGILEARRLHEQAYAGRRRAVGDRHQETLYSATSYGRVLRATGELRESRRLLEGALTMSRSLLGSEDPTTLSITRELAATQRRLGELEAARTLGRHTLQIYDQIRKPEHPDRLSCMNTLALTYSALGNQPEALQLGQQCVNLHGERFGGAISSTWLVRANLASYLRRTGELAAARDLIDTVVEGLTQLFESTNVFVLQASIISANVRFASGAPEEARQIEEWVYDAMAGPLGESHPDRLVAGCNLAASREALGETAGLAEFRRELAAEAVRVLPARHPIALAITNGDRWECELDLPGS